MSKLLVLVCITINFLMFAESLDKDLSLTKNDKRNGESEREEKEIDRSMASAQAETAGMNGFRPRPFINIIQCYACSDCPVILMNTTVKQCSYTSDYTKQNKCVVYVEQYKHMKKPWYIRGCASERNSCAEVRRAHEQHKDILRLVSCQECEGDRCNTSSVSRSLSDLLITFLVLVFNPVSIKKLI